MEKTSIINSLIVVQCTMYVYTVQYTVCCTVQCTMCMLFLIIYIQIRWHSVISRFLKVLIQMTAFIAAYVTCLSRISDHHHHGTDVFGGVVIGCVIAFFMFFCVGRELIKLNHNYHKKSSLSYNLKI